MTRILLASLMAFLFLLGQPVLADLQVNFIESAPKDRFIIRNTGSCEFKNIIMDIDLSQSKGGLVFDTTATGAGLEVYQPFEVTQGAIELIHTDIVEDGDTQLSLGIQSLPKGKVVSFTIDVDDTLPASELGRTRVTGSEITGGLVRVEITGQKPVIAEFGDDSKAIVLLPPCP